MRATRSIRFPLFLLSTLACLSITTHGVVKEETDGAMKLYREGQFGAAGQMLESAYQKADKDALYYTLSGAIAAAQMNWGAAEKAFRQSARLEPNEASHRMNLAEILYSRGNYLDAAEHYGAANRYAESELNKVLATYKELLCRLLLKQNNEAKEIFKTLAPSKAHPLYYFACAVNAFAAGKLEEGRYFVRSAQLLFPDSDNQRFLQSILEQGWMQESELAAKR